MPRLQQSRAAIEQRTEQHLAAYIQAVQQGDSASLAVIASSLAESGDSVEVLNAMLRVAAQCRAENAVLKTHLDEKNELLQSLLAEPRRIDQMLGLIREQSNGRETVWAVLKGPPCQAAPLGPGVARRRDLPRDAQ